jgi:(2R)-3-sulfolactate dehydrogenase (NADP+)
VAGSEFSFEASGFGGNAGGPPDVGQVVLAIDPTATMGASPIASSTSCGHSAEPGVRLPGDRRLEHRRSAESNGVELPDDLMAVLNEYAVHGSPATPA